MNTIYSNIYVFTNKINNKKYVGQSINPKERYKQHIKDSKNDNLLFHNAINKYGIDNFDFEIIEKDVSIEEIGCREMFWIKELNSKKPNGYNLTDGGEGTIGYSHTEEAKIKMSCMKKGKFTHYQTQETRDKISMANKGTKPSDFCIKRAIETNKGRSISEETKKKISDSSKGVKKSPKHVEKVRKALLNRKEEDKKKSYAKAVKTKRNNGVEFGKHFLELSDEDKKLMYEKISINNKRSTPIKGVNILDGSIVEFHSIGAAGKWVHESLGYSKNAKVTIRDSIKSNGTAYGYKWLYV